MTAHTDRFTLMLNTEYAFYAGQIANFCKRVERGIWEPRFLNACFETVKPDDELVEIGTWIGPYSVILAKYVLKKGRLIGFEPDPAAYRQCVLNFNLNSVTNAFVLPLAISDKTGTLPLFTNRFFGNSGSSLFQTLPDEVGEQDSVEVPCAPLDPIVRALDLNPSVVKLDVEGAEDLVLQGARETVAKDGVRLLLEVHHEYLTQRGKSANDVLAQVADLGKEIYYIEGDEDGPYEYMQKMDPAQPITIPNFRVVAR